VTEVVGVFVRFRAPLHPEIGLGHFGLQTLPSEFKSIAAGNVGGDASKRCSKPPTVGFVVLSDRRRHLSHDYPYPGGSVRAFEVGVPMDVGWCAQPSPNSTYSIWNTTGRSTLLYGHQRTPYQTEFVAIRFGRWNGIYSTDGQG
jgi:hypothetical protein